MALNRAVDISMHALGLSRGFDYDQITDEVFIGTNMCCQFGFDRELLAKNVRADISLEKEHLDAPEGVDYFLWLPTEDHTPPSQDQMVIGVQAIEELVRRKIKVYIHCKNGHGRGPTLFIAYLVKTGMSIDDAFAFIKSKRKSIHVDENQFQALRIFAESLRKP